MIKSQLLSYLDIEAAHFEIEETWKSGPKDHRQNLRSALLNTLGDRSKFPRLSLSQETTAAITDLSQPPQIEHFSISISHCPLAGGFVICPLQDGLVGLDLEDRTKITPGVVGRVGSEQELLLAPNAALLWAAKEATFKSLLKASQPKALSNIELVNWYTIEPHVWGFQAQIQGVKTGPLLGVAAFLHNLVVGLAKFTP